MTMIIATPEGIWADRHIEHPNSATVVAKHECKIHKLDERLWYAASGDVIDPASYEEIKLNFFTALTDKTPFKPLPGQEAGHHFFLYKQTVYRALSDRRIFPITDQNEYQITGSETTLGYLLQYDGLSPSDIIRETSRVSMSVSRAYDFSLAENNQ